MERLYILIRNLRNLFFHALSSRQIQKDAHSFNSKWVVIDVQRLFLSGEYSVWYYLQGWSSGRSFWNIIAKSSMESLEITLQISAGLLWIKFLMSMRYFVSLVRSNWGEGIHHCTLHHTTAGSNSGLSPNFALINSLLNSPIGTACLAGNNTGTIYDI